MLGYIKNCIETFANQSVLQANVISLPGLLMCAGIGVYPNGWDSPEVQQACGYTSKA